MGEHLDLGIGINAAGAQQSEKATKSLLGTLKNYIKNMFTLSSATEQAGQQTTSHVDTVALSEDVYERVGSALSSLRNKLLALAGVYAASDVFQRAIEAGKNLEQLYTRMANRFGNEAFAQSMTNWINSTTNRLPIAQEEMEQFIATMDQFAINPQLANLEGVLSAALGPGESLSNTMSQITSLAESGDMVGFVEAFAGRVSPQEIAESLQGAVTVQERIIALTELLDREFGENIARHQNTVKGQMGLLKNMFDQFKNAFVGNPEAGTLFGEYRLFVQQFTDWFLERKDDIIAFGQELGRFFGRIFRLFRRNFFNLGEFSNRAFSIIRGFIQNSRELVNPFVLFLAILMEKVKTFFSGFREGFVEFFTDFKAGLMGMAEGFQFIMEDILGIEMGDLTGGLQDLIELLIRDDVVRDFGKAIGYLTGMFVAFIGLRKGISMVAGAIAWLLTPLTKIISIATNAGKALLLLAAGKGKLLASVGGLGAVISPIAVALLSLAGAAFAVYKAWDMNLFGLRDDLDPLMNWIQEIFEETSEFITDSWDSVSSELSQFVGEIKPELKAIWNAAEPLVKLFGTTIVESLRFAGQAVWDFTRNTVVAAFNIIKDTAQGLWEIFKGVVNTLVDLLTGDFTGVLQGLKEVAQGIAGIFRDNLGNIKSFMVSMFSDAFRNIVSRIDNMADAWKEIFSGMFNWLADKVNSYIIGPMNTLAGIIGLEIPRINVNTGAQQGTGGGTPIEITPTLGNTGLSPAPADQSGRQVTNNRSFNINVTARPGENPESVARRVYRELETKERRKSERGQ